MRGEEGAETAAAEVFAVQWFFVEDIDVGSEVAALEAVAQGIGVDKGGRVLNLLKMASPRSASRRSA